MTLPDLAREPEVRDAIERALAEDVRDGDATSLALVPADVKVRAAVIAREACVVAGTGVAAATFRAVDDAIACDVLVADGSTAAAGQAVMHLEGPAQGILTAERTALNFMQRMTGIATLTQRFVEKAAPYGTVILDTRKTTPTLRVLEKYAVLCGGGENHRMGLYDRVMIKDNHRRLWQGGETGRLDLAVAAARERYPDLAVEVEVESLAELDSALAGHPEWVLLDNMDPARLAACVARCGGRARLEASGGITLANIEAVAATGVDAVSLGCLTHSAPAADLSLEILPDALPRR